MTKHRSHRVIYAGHVRFPVVGSGIGLALVVNLVVSLILLPVTANPYDFALITGSANAWLNWHLSLFLYWKFGLDYAGINLAAACGARVLAASGLSVPAAAHISFKLFLVLANLLAALALWRLAVRYRPRLAVTLAVLWLLSPVVIWVAAFHGQIEPVAAAATLWALWLISDRRWLFAGVVTGIGVGFEYVPIVALVTVATLVISKRVRILDGVLYSVALGVTLAICFSQLFLSTTGGRSLHQGIIGHATASGAGANVKPGSVWYLINTRLIASLIEPHWLLLLAALSVVISCTAAWSVKHGSDTAPFAAAGVILLASTFLDPTTLPQFGVLAMVGLCLMALEARIPNGIIAAAPALTLLGYAFVQPMYAHFEDVDPHVTSQIASLLPQFPLVPFMYPQLAALAMDLGIVAIGIWVIQTGRTIRHGLFISSPKNQRSSLIIIVSTELMILLLVVVWSVQPRLWSGVLGGNPPSLFDTPYLTSKHVDVSTRVSATTVRGVFDPSLLSAMKSTHPSPIGVVEYRPRQVASQEVVGVGSSSKFMIRMPSIHSNGTLRVSRIGISLLLHNRAWTSAGLIDGHARIDGMSVMPCSENLILPTWAKVVYEVPVRDIAHGARMESVSVQLLSKNTIVNGGRGLGPWFIAWDSAGEIRTSTDHGQHWKQFYSPTPQQGQIFFTFPEITSRVTVPSLSGISSFVIDEALIWPDSNALFARPQSSLQWSLGILYLMSVLVALVLVCVRCIRAFTTLDSGQKQMGGDVGRS